MVDVPITDYEIFGHLVLGRKPIERPIKMKYSEYKSIKGVAIAGLALTAILLGTMVYQDVQKYYHGSFSEAYNSFQEDFKRFPFSTLH